jgi:hypothetical protein
MRIVYTVWFRDGEALPDDPDGEWPACFVVDAPSLEDGRSWGDHLARQYATASGQQFLHSEAEDVEDCKLPGIDQLPTVEFGREASRSQIGW